MMDQERHRLRSFVERIERLEAEVRDLNRDKAEVYKEVRAANLDHLALKAVISARRKKDLDPAEYEDRTAHFDLYMLALVEVGTVVATRAPATSEIRAGIPAGDDGSPSVPSEPVAVPAAPDTGVHLAQGSQAADPNPMPAFLDRRKAARAHLEPAE